MKRQKNKKATAPNEIHVLQLIEDSQIDKFMTLELFLRTSTIIPSPKRSHSKNTKNMERGVQVEGGTLKIRWDVIIDNI